LGVGGRGGTRAERTADPGVLAAAKAASLAAADGTASVGSKSFSSNGAYAPTPPPPPGPLTPFSPPLGITSVGSKSFASNSVASKPRRAGKPRAMPFAGTPPIWTARAGAGEGAGEGEGSAPARAPSGVRSMVGVARRGSAPVTPNAAVSVTSSTARRGVSSSMVRSRGFRVSKPGVAPGGILGDVAGAEKGDPRLGAAGVFGFACDSAIPSSPTSVVSFRSSLSKGSV